MFAKSLSNDQDQSTPGKVKVTHAKKGQKGTGGCRQGAVLCWDQAAQSWVSSFQPVPWQLLVSLLPWRPWDAFALLCTITLGGNNTGTVLYCGESAVTARAVTVES